MLKAKMTNGDLVFGITDENISRLKKGQPIRINLKDMGLEDRIILITYGKDEETIFTGMIDHVDINKTKINYETR